MVSSRVLRYAGLAVGAVALVIALLPFATNWGDSLLLAHSTSCGPPIVEATRTPPKDGGWFGYAPLTATPSGFEAHPCYEPARHRLTISAIGLFAAGRLGWFAGRIDRPGRFYRRRWRTRPA